MGIIGRLDQHVAELIAAGEVVERPASIVKEVVENAIDAGASTITVEIQHGGITFIRVTDNGSGMYAEDVPLAFISHATSKVHTADDLEAIVTMGFRGEALASIAAVARIELLTRREESLEGIRYVIAGGKELENAPAGCPKGTTLLVRDLFYNTPARLKFIKKDVSEANAVTGVLEKLALAHPNISFKLIRDGELRLNTPGDGKLLSAVYAVYKRDFASSLCKVDYQNGGLAMEGFLSRPEASRPNRSMQTFFINRRYVKSRTCAAALEEACKGSVMAGKFPACVLNLTIAPDTVDVNVHPAKIEVRFSNEKAVFDLVYFGVKNALSTLHAPEITIKPQKSSPTFAVREVASEQLRISSSEYRKLAGLTFATSAHHNQQGNDHITVPTPTESGMHAHELLSLHDDNSLLNGYHTSQKQRNQATYNVTSDSALHTESVIQADFLQESVIFDQPDAPCQAVHDATVLIDGNATVPAQDYIALAKAECNLPSEIPQLTALPHSGRFEGARMVGEVFSTYILLENKEQLFIIDKHAAHERILYERLKAKQEGEWQQTLLASVTVTLAHGEYSAALENFEALAACGFEAEDFGGCSLVVRTAPMWLTAGEVPAVISELCASLAAHRHDITPEVLHLLYHSVACRSAIKGGNKNTTPELAELIRLLESDETITHCPHGRPVAITMTRHELEKRFGRV